MKRLFFDKTAKEKLALGADILAKAVVSTLGPQSNNVVISRKNETPLIAHDGVTVAKNVIPLEDRELDVGARLLLQASRDTNDMVGDGTTTATLIANTLIQGGVKLTIGGLMDGEIRTKYNPMDIKRKLDMVAVAIEKLIKKKAVKLKGDLLKNVAYISSNDKDIANIVVEAVEKTGEGGLIMAGTSPTFDTFIEYKEGMEFDNGYLSPYFVTHAESMSVEYPESYILFADFTIHDPQVLVPLAEKVLKSGKPLTIIANDVVGLALQALVQIKLKGQLNVCAIVAPEFADLRKEMLEDMAIMTGGIVLSPDKQDKLEDVEIDDLGLASIKSTSTHTILTPKNVDKDELSARITAVREQIQKEPNKFRKERLKNRLARLSQGIAIINVGGASETEINDRKLRIEDAIHAVRASLEEGVVAGGGVCLRDICREYFNYPVEDKLEQLIVEALNKPYLQILENSNVTSSMESFEDGRGIDVMTNVPVNMLEAGIVDPAKVTRLAIRHAFSVAGMFLTTSSMIIDIDEPTQKMELVNRNNG